MGIKQKVASRLGDGARRNRSASSLERAGTIVSQLRRRVQIDERLDQLTAAATSSTRRSHESLDRQVPPTWQVISHGIIFRLRRGLVLASVFLPVSMLHG